MSPTTSTQSPCLSRITAQLAVGDLVEILLPPVDSSGRVFLRKSPFWSRPKADINDTAPFNLSKPSAMFRPTPPPENFVSDLYVAPFSCSGNKQKENSVVEIFFALYKKWRKGKSKFMGHEHVKKSFMSCDKNGTYCYVSFAVFSISRWKAYVT